MSLIRGSIGVIFAVMVYAVAVMARVVPSARAELKSADELVAAGNLDGAIERYRRSARCYAPGSPYHVIALDKLATMGEQAEQRADVAQALAAYRSVRAAILSARSFYIPERERLASANRHIAALMASVPSTPEQSTAPLDQRYRDYLTQLESRPGPNFPWSAVALLGFVVWVSAAYAFTLRAIDAHGHWVGRQAARWGTLIVLGLGCFALGLALA